MYVLEISTYLKYLNSFYHLYKEICRKILKSARIRYRIRIRIRMWTLNKKKFARSGSDQKKSETPPKARQY